MRPEQQTTIPENPDVHILDLVLFCHKHTFNVVKQQNKVYQVNLCIFLPHLHIKFIKSGATVIKLWNKAFLTWHLSKFEIWT